MRIKTLFITLRFRGIVKERLAEDIQVFINILTWFFLNIVGFHDCVKKGSLTVIENLNFIIIFIKIVR